MNPRTTKDKALNLAPLARLGYPCVRCPNEKADYKPFSAFEGRSASMSGSDGITLKYDDA